MANALERVGALAVVLHMAEQSHRQALNDGDNVDIAVRLYREAKDNLDAAIRALPDDAFSRSGITVK